MLEDIGLHPYLPYGGFLHPPTQGTHLAQFWPGSQCLFFLAVLGLRCCAQAFSSCGERGLLFIAVASLTAEHGL